MERKYHLLLILVLMFVSACKKDDFSGEGHNPNWKVDTQGDTGWNSPAIGPDGTIYIGDISGRLMAVTPGGSVKWKKKIASDLSGSSPALTADGAKIYIGEMASPGRVFCVNASDGSVLWSWTLPTPTHLPAVDPGTKAGGGINSTPAISQDENTIYFGSGNWIECNPCTEDIVDDRLFALDVSGEQPILKWVLRGSEVDAIQNPERLSFWASPTIASDGSIYIGNFNGFIYRVQDDGSSYSILNRFNLDPHKTPKAVAEGISPEVWSTCALDDDGTVYVASNDGQLWAFDASLNVLWKVQFKYGNQYYEAFATPVITPNGLVIMGNEKGYLEAFDKESGQMAWRYPDGNNPPEEWWRTPAVSASGLLILGSEKSGRYFAINSADGTEAWRTSEIGLETGCFPAIADDGTIYVTGGYEGGLYAFSGDSPLANTAYPKGLRNNRNSGNQ